MHTDYKKTVSATDAKAISAFLKNVILAGGNHAEIIMTATQKK
jgi:zinc protease